MEDRQRVQRTWKLAGGLAVKLFLTYFAVSMMIATARASRFDSWLGWANQIPFSSSPSPPDYKTPSTLNSATGDREFQLKHVFQHGTHRYPDVHMRMDVEPTATLHTLDDDGRKQLLPSIFRVRSHDTMIERLSDRRVSTMRTMYDNSRLAGLPAVLEHPAWIMDEVSGPNTTDKETVVNLAKMSWCAYVKEPGTGEWQDIGGGFNESQGLGWEGDSLRGHVFADKDNSTIIIALKGTSPGTLYLISSPTTGLHFEQCGSCDLGWRDWGTVCW